MKCSLKVLNQYELDAGAVKRWNIAV